MKKVYIHPYLFSSKGYQILRSRLMGVCIEDLPVSGVVINWGSRGTFPEMDQRIINPMKIVKKVSNKQSFFLSCREAENPPRIPIFFTTVDAALDAVYMGKTVMGRSLHGSSGSGIVFFEESPTAFMRAEFWVQYKKKISEYRVHIMNSEIFLVQKKFIRVSLPDGSEFDSRGINTRIRSHKNGYIFGRYNFTVPEDCINQALLAYKVSGLDFGAVDVIWNAYEQKAYVLEINTAPGMTGTTPADYIKAFKKHYL